MKLILQKNGGEGLAREYFPKYCELSRDVFDQVKAIMKGYPHAVEKPKVPRSSHA